MSEVVTELVIDANTSGAADFSRAMEGAEQAANNGLSSVTGFNVGVAALGASAAGAVVGVKALLDHVVDANKSLADMLTISNRVGLSLRDFQGLQFGGAIKGLDTAQINAGLEKSAALLNDASRNSNSLSKELAENGISVKNANGQLITENQLLGIAANLIRNARNPGDQDAIAQMLGFTKEWIPLLEQGGAAISGLAADAERAGAIIDDETIKRAAQFDAEWRKSSVEFASYMKAAISGVLPVLDDLIERASKWSKSFNVADIEKAAQEQLNALGAPLGLPKDDEAIAIKLQIPDSVSASWDRWVTKVNKAYDLLKWLSQDPNTQKILDDVGSGVQDLIMGPLGKRGFDVLDTGSNANFADRFSGKANQPWVSRVDPHSVPGFDASQIVEPSYPTAEQMDKAFAKSSAESRQKAKDWADDAAGDAADGFSKVAARDVGKDAVDTAIDRLRKHTAQQEADTLAAGLGAGALAKFRAEAAETAAVLANGGKETDAQAAEFAKLRQRAEDAATALAKARVAVDIKFNRDTAFLTQEDVQIASQLKDIYPDVAAALNSAEANQIRFNNSLKQLSSLGQDVNRSFFVDFTTGLRNGKSGFDSLASAGLNALGKIADKLASMAADNLWNSAFGGSGGGSLLSFLGIGGSGASFGATSTGSAGVGFLGGLYHSGGIVGSEPTMGRYVHPAYFDDAPRFHGGGIAGDEVPIIARKGEGVFTPGQMAAMGGSGPNITYAPNIDARGADAQAVARLTQALAEDRKNFERNVTATMAKYRANNPGAR